jgi:hypothetical protein
MVTRRTIALSVAAVAAVGALAYLRDPPWLITQTTGLHRWEQQPGTPRYRWSGGHASFFVRADAGAFDIPLSTTFDQHDDPPMMVTVSVDDETAARVVLTDAAWTRIRITLPPPGTRTVRRIDIRTNVTRDDNHGVRVGEIERLDAAVTAR